MYYYIYDSFLNEKKYDRILAKIENRLANFEINGKITKITKLKSIEDNIKEEIKNTGETIVAVGDDMTVLKILNLIIDYDNVVLGIIPLGYNLEISRLLGIPFGEDSCEIISSRKVEVIDIGKINNRYFISNIDLGSDPNLEIMCGDKYTIKPIGNNNVKICNISGEHKVNKKYFNPKDGQLDLVFEYKQTFARKLLKKEKLDKSIFPVKELLVQGKKSLLVPIDNNTVLKTPLTVKILPKKLKIIVGKDRVF